MSENTPDDAQATDDNTADTTTDAQVTPEPVEGASGRRLGPDGGGLGYPGLLARREARRGRGPRADAIETEPGTEGNEPVVIEGEPVADGEAGEPAQVIGLDGNDVPAGPDGIPVLSVADEGYDPSEHTVAEVQDYLGGHPDQSDYVLDRERTGKSRVTLIGA